jgi:hypothetical protein
MIWVYAICEGPELPFEVVGHGRLLAVIGRDNLGEPNLDSLLEHERMVEAIMADRVVLPMRFGTTLPDEAALAKVLAEREDEFLAALERVRGRVEVGVRDTRTPAPAEAQTGREYLEAKLRHTREADALHQPLAGLAVAAERKPSETLRASYLVEAGDLDEFCAAAERLDLHVTGPWPPYSFVGDLR